MEFIIPIKIFASAVAIYLAVPTIKGFKNGSGPLLTPKENIRKTFNYIKIGHCDKIYDLGIGTGRVLAIADQDFHAQIYGFELSPLLYFYAKLKLLIKGANSKGLKREDFFNCDLSGADVVYCFLSFTDLGRLKKKLKDELKEGTWVVTYCFPIENWKVERVFNFDNPGKMYLYKIKKGSIMA